MEKYYKKYIITLLEWQKTKLQCINLGMSTNESIKNEIKLINETLKYIKGR